MSLSNVFNKIKVPVFIYVMKLFEHIATNGHNEHSVYLMCVIVTLTVYWRLLHTTLVSLALLTLWQQFVKNCAQSQTVKTELWNTKK